MRVVAVTRPKNPGRLLKLPQSKQLDISFLRLSSNGNSILECHRNRSTSQLHGSNSPPCSGYNGGFRYLPIKASTLSSSIVNLFHNILILCNTGSTPTTGITPTTRTTGTTATLLAHPPELPWVHVLRDSMCPHT